MSKRTSRGGASRVAHRMAHESGRNTSDPLPELSAKEKIRQELIAERRKATTAVEREEEITEVTRKQNRTMAELNEPSIKKDDSVLRGEGVVDSVKGARSLTKAPNVEDKPPRDDEEIVWRWPTHGRQKPKYKNRGGRPVAM